MAIKRWHAGKIVMLWAWGAALVLVDLQALKEFRQFLTEHVLVGFTFLALLLLVPLTLSVVTWRWFSGKETAVNTSIVKPDDSSRHHRPKGI
jgi:hypothetical protein